MSVQSAALVVSSSLLLPDSESYVPRHHSMVPGLLIMVAFSVMFTECFPLSLSFIFLLTGLVSVTGAWAWVLMAALLGMPVVEALSIWGLADCSGGHQDISVTHPPKTSIYTRHLVNKDVVCVEPVKITKINAPVPLTRPSELLHV